MSNKLSQWAVVVVAAAFLAAPTQQACATTYNDAIGENNPGIAQSGGILDISSVEVNNNATDLMFKLTLVGDIQATDWGNYMVAIDTVPGGDTTGNPWGPRPISMPSGMDYWLGSWVNSGGGVQTWDYTGVWNGPTTTGVTVEQYAVSFSVPLASLGLSVGNSFNFDVYSSGGGGGDSAVDALANPNQTIADWPGPYSSNTTYSYTVVPEPSTWMLVAMGGLLVLGRAFRRR
jgi:hypothetical protein